MVYWTVVDKGDTGAEEIVANWDVVVLGSDATASEGSVFYCGWY